MTADTTPTAFDNATARAIKPGDEIIARNPKGVIVKRYPVTAVDQSPAGCPGKVHVTIQGGARWCYESAATVETQ